MKELNLQEWLMEHPPKETMIYKNSFWNEYVYMSDILLGRLFNDKDYKTYDEFIDNMNKIHEVVGEHWSKSILHPVIKIVYKGTTIVFRYNFYDYEIAVISDHPVYIPNMDLFTSKGESFYYQGFPEEYIINDRYEDNKYKFMANVRSTFDFHAFMYLLKLDIETNKKGIDKDENPETLD